jgi:hypothetical protein
MTQGLGASCCVCGASDARTLVDVILVGGARATLCGSHATMQRRSKTRAHTPQELRESLRERRGRSDRREDGDELGIALEQAFQGDRREQERRRA